MPPGMFPDSQAELNKANWALGLGIASLFCGCFTFIPALIIGWPLMKNAKNADAKSRAKVGIVFGLVALGLSLLSMVMGGIFFVTATAKVDHHLKEIEREIRQTDKSLRELKDSRFNMEDEEDEK